MTKKKESNMVTGLTIFLGYIHRNGATEEEKKAVVRTISLLKKYLPFYQKKES